MNVLTILSAILLIGFIALGVGKFGLKSSYSLYAKYWDEIYTIPPHNSIWSLITAISAFLIVPAMVVKGEGNIAQCLGFITPCYLLAVSATPNWHKNKNENIVHTYSAIMCALCAFLWAIFVAHVWPIVPICLLLSCAFLYYTKKWNCTVFCLEMSMFISTYVALLW